MDQPRLGMVVLRRRIDLKQEVAWLRSSLNVVTGQRYNTPVASDNETTRSKEVDLFARFIFETYPFDFR